MSLTSQIQDKNSPVSHWFAAHLDHHEAVILAREINDYVAARPALTVKENKEYSLVGMAFDYGSRWLLGPLDTGLVAMLGALKCKEDYAWKDALAIARSIIE